ncbi:hypothetical protein PSTT_11592 [Puccinia striiformis]|nr:hypothetical protein PSTT_11592 [Puccinia striiformis]
MKDFKGFLTEEEKLRGDDNNCVKRCLSKHTINPLAQFSVTNPFVYSSAIAHGILHEAITTCQSRLCVMLSNGQHHYVKRSHLETLHHRACMNKTNSLFQRPNLPTDDQCEVIIRPEKEVSVCKRMLKSQED